MEQEMTLDLKELYEVIKKRVGLILVITLSCVFISAVLSFFIIPPTYEAQTSIIIGKDSSKTEGVKYDEVLMYQNVVKTYSEIAKSRVVAEKTADEIGDGITPEEVLKSISVLPQANTQILIIKSTGKEPEKISNIVNEHAKNFIEASKTLYPAGSVQIMDKATLPKSPIKPRPMINIAIALFLGLMVSLGLVFIEQYMDSTIKTEDDVKKYLDLPVIGIIPKNIEG